MPFPLIPVIVAAASAIGQHLLQRRADKKSAQDSLKVNQQLAEYSFNKNQDAIQAQNQYNSPAQQIARYQAAGLNPALMYGPGASAGDQSSVARYETPEYQRRFTALEIPDVIQKSQDFRMRAAQTDNVEADAEYTRQRTINESIETTLREIGVLKGQKELRRFDQDFAIRNVEKSQREFDLQKQSTLFPYQIDAARLGLSRQTQELEKGVQSLIQMKNAQTLQMLEAEQRRKGLSKVDLEIEGLRKTNEFKDFQNAWRRQGVTESDNLGFRFLGRMWDSLIKQHPNPETNPFHRGYNKADSLLKFDRFKKSYTPSDSSYFRYRRERDSREY